MFFARVQDQLANPAVTAMGWCVVSAKGEKLANCALAYRVLSSGTAAEAIQIAHRGSFSGLCVTKPSRLGNPEDTA